MTNDVAIADETTPQADVSGRWEGHIEYGGTRLLMVFNIDRDDSGDYTATVDTPAQNAYGIPIESVSVEGSEVVLAITATGAVYEATIHEPSVDESSATMVGNWKQSGLSIPLEMRRTGDVDRFSRPQDPRPPYPYEVEEVTFPNLPAGITLAGTITRPGGEGPFPGIVLITGSGPQNRNEEVFDHRPFLVLADALTRAGFAVLRYDDRGVGGSEAGDQSPTMVDFAGDAASGRDYLRNQSYVDGARVGFLGHSEGGIIAPMIAADDPSVAFVIALAGSAVPGHEILVEQSGALLRAGGASEEVIALSADVNSRTYRAIMEGGDTPETRETVTTILKEIGMQQAQIDAQLPVLFSPWYMHFLGYDPRVALERLTCPVLALFGTLDLQVPSEQNLSPFETALQAAPTDTYRVVAIEGKNHLFQTAETGHIDEYAKIEETISPEVIALIIEWLATVTQ